MGLRKNPSPKLLSAAQWVNVSCPLPLDHFSTICVLQVSQVLRFLLLLLLLSLWTNGLFRTVSPTGRLLVKTESFVYSAASPLWRRHHREETLAKQAFISIIHLAYFHGCICSSLLFVATIQLQAHMYDSDLDELILSYFHLGQTVEITTLFCVT